MGEARARGGARADAARLDAVTDSLAIQPNKGREMQFARVARRKLFGKAAQALFLEWFAATGNCVFSAAKAGFCHQTIWRHRMNDAAFREAFDAALEQGIVRAKASLLEMKAKEGPIEIGGDLDDIELVPPDPATVLTLVREYERARSGVRKRGRAPRVASEAEVDAALAKRLAAYSKRVRGIGGGALATSAAGEEAPPPHVVRSPSPSGLGEDEG
jgi:hypothetical protein